MKKFIVVIILIFVCVGFVKAQINNDTIPKGKYEFGSKIYPGIQPEEVFITVIPGSFKYDTDGGIEWADAQILIKNFDAILWKTKRLGKIAYDIKGNIIAGWYPVFAQEQELIEAGSLKDQKK